MIKQWMKCAALSVALAVASPLALAQGSKAFEPTTQLAGQTLQLNGQGVRYRAIIPVYEMALYTPKKVTTPEQLLGLPGPKRVSFVALRDVPGDQLGIALVRGMSENADPGRAALIAGYMDKLGRIFSTEKKIAAGQAFEGLHGRAAPAVAQRDQIVQQAERPPPSATTWPRRPTPSRCSKP